MSYVDRIGNKLNQQKNKKKALNTYVYEKYSEAFKTLIDKFAQDVASNKIEIRDSTDLDRLVNVLQTLSQEADDAQSSGIPELNDAQTNIIEHRVSVTTRKTTDEEGEEKKEKTISLDDLKNMSNGSVGALMSETEKEKNKENVEDVK